MRGSLRRWLVGLAVAVAIVVAAVAGFAAAVQAGFLRNTFLHLVSVRAGRPITVDGALRIELLSWTPSITAERVVIGNPHWMPPGRMAEIGTLSLVFEVPRRHHRFGVDSLSMNSASLHLVRDALGRANWQWSDPTLPYANTKLAIVRSLTVPHAHVTLEDDRRHLKFDGIASAEGPPAGAQVRIWGEGDLNGHPASFEIKGDSLASASHQRPYHFSYTEHSSGSHLEGEGVLPRPFDFNALESTFQAGGEDLQDLYYLVGVHMINTGAYRLTGKLERDALHFNFSDLSVHSGQSDLRGSIGIDSSRARPQLDVRLESHLLKIADIGLRAAGRAPPESAPPLLLSKAALSPGGFRPDDATIVLHIDQVELTRLKLQDVAAKGSLDHGVLTVQSMSGRLLGGEAQGRGKLDVNEDPPLADVDLKLTGLELGQMRRKEGDSTPGAPPPIEGTLRARIVVSGRGSSLHQVAATANGFVTVVVPHGTVRDSLAELAGMDLRALGLLMSKDTRDTALRCAIAVFKDHDGTLTAQDIVADTEPVLITGSGQIQFDTETLDLTLQGEPKELRLFHWRSPVLIKGTLSHPAIDIHARKFELVDTGKAKDADCGALIASADSEDARPHAPAPKH
jgi:AsmA family protein